MTTTVHLRRGTPMKDHYPHAPAVDPAFLVPPEAQPDYVDDGVVRLGDDVNVGVFLSDRQVELGRGEQLAALDGETGRGFTFRELAEQSTRLASGLLKLGLKPGERVCYRTPNVAEALVVMLAIWKAGGVLVPVPVQATSRDMRFYFEDTGGRFLFAHMRAGDLNEVREAAAGTGIEEIFVFGEGAANVEGFRTMMELLPIGEFEDKLPVGSGDSVAILWHTGGTTGLPKGCYHTHRRFLLGGYAIGVGTNVKPGERWTACAPIGHALGIIYHTIYTLLHGATAVLIEHFHDPRIVIEAIARNRIDTVTGLSASWAKMLDVLDADPQLDMSSVKRAYAMWQSASSSDVYDRWLKRGIELLNNFGSTSFATWVLVPPPGVKSPRGSLGRPAPGYQVAAIEVKDGKVKALPAGEIGQLAVKGPTGLTYWNRPELQRRDVVDGWTLSDDLIRFDEEGNAHYLGRTDYMISTGGFKVAPVEVEQVLARHPAVREVAVVPGPCPTYQEMVVAFIALRPGHEPSDALKKELRDFAKADLVSYKAPRRVEFIDALPRDHVGKVQTRVVKDWATQLPATG